MSGFLRALMRSLKFNVLFIFIIMPITGEVFQLQALLRRFPHFLIELEDWGMVVSGELLLLFLYVCYHYVAQIVIWVQRNPVFSIKHMFLFVIFSRSIVQRFR